MTGYIITEEELLDTRSYIYHEDEEAFIKIERNVRSHPYQSERYRPVCYPDCENEKRIRKDAQETVIDRVILEMVYSEKGFPKTVKEFSERITQLRQQAGE